MLTAQKQDLMLSKELSAKIDLVLASHEYDRTQIVGILVDVQNLIEEHYIPETTAYYVAEKLDLKITTIYDCISFYSSLSEKPRAKYPIQICNSIVCSINDNDAVFSTFKELLGIELNEVTYDGRFTLESVPCFGACDVAPAVRINGQVYGHLDSRAKIETLLNKLL